MAGVVSKETFKILTFGEVKQPLKYIAGQIDLGAHQGSKTVLETYRTA